MDVQVLRTCCIPKLKSFGLQNSLMVLSSSVLMYFMWMQESKLNSKACNICPTSCFIQEISSNFTWLQPLCHLFPAKAEMVGFCIHFCFGFHMFWGDVHR